MALYSVRFNHLQNIEVCIELCIRLTEEPSCKTRLRVSGHLPRPAGVSDTRRERTE